MQKKIIEEKIEKEIFVAEDGAEFTSERECEDHEREIRWANILRLPTRIAKLDNVCPLNYDDCPDCSQFVWFKLNSSKDVEALNKLLPETVDEFKKPRMVCVENRYDDYYIFDFEDGVEYAKQFFENFGLTINITPSGVPEKKKESCISCKDCRCSSCIENQSLTVIGRCVGCEYCGEEDITCLVAGDSKALEKNGGKK